MMCGVSGSSMWDQSCPQEGGEQAGSYEWLVPNALSQGFTPTPTLETSSNTL